MEGIVRNVRDIDAGERRSFEHIIGRSLRDDQRLIIQIAEVDVWGEPPVDDARQPQSLDDWTNVYEGLSDEEIAAVDKIINTRAIVTRNVL